MPREVTRTFDDEGRVIATTSVLLGACLPGMRWYYDTVGF